MDSSQGAITAVNLRVPTLEQLEPFYRNLLGMQYRKCAGDSLSFAFDESRCRINFKQSNVTEFVERRNGFYWKIGITVKNLDVAVAWLRQQGVGVSPPRQFLDIGYLCHLQDPCGFTIELLQQGFEGREQPVAGGHPLGAQATLAHITLRVTDIHRAQQYLVSQLGMRLMSVQMVGDYNFCLYFYTWSDEALPHADVESVANREWLWARPYPFIELQHLLSPGAVIHRNTRAEAGFEGVHCKQGSGAEVLLTLDELTGDSGCNS
jgi:catechol-2,3-dioxygenase